MDFNEKHIETVDNLIKYIMRSRPPEDANGEEMLALYPCYVFLVTLKKSIQEDMQQKLQQQQAQAEAAKAQAASNQTSSEPVGHGKVNTKSKSKRSKSSSKKSGDK